MMKMSSSMRMILCFRLYLVLISIALISNKCNATAGDEKEELGKRKREEGDSSNSDGSKRHYGEKERNLNEILKNAPLLLERIDQFPQYFTDILLTNGLIDSVKSIEPLVGHQKFMVEKLGQYDAEWQNGEIIINEFKKKITKTGDLLKNGIEGVIKEIEEMELLPKVIEEMEPIKNVLDKFLKSELLANKKDSMELNNKLEWILIMLGNKRFDEILKVKFDHLKGNLQKFGAMKILDSRLAILQRLIVEFEYFLTRGQKLWKKFGNKSTENDGQSKGKEHKNDTVGPINSANTDIIKEIFDEEMEILGWMKKLNEIGLDAIELHVSLQKWYLSPNDQKLREETKEKLSKLKKFLNDKMEIVGIGANYIGKKLEEMNEKGLRIEFLERKMLEAVIKKLINYENYYSSSMGIEIKMTKSDDLIG